MSEEKTIACELCGGEAEWGGPSNGDSTNIICGACGAYAVSGQWRAGRMVDHLEEPDRVRLRAVVRRDTDEHGRCREVITTKGWRQVMARHDGPTDALTQMERLLVLLAERAPFYGAVSAIDSTAAMAVRAYLPRMPKGDVFNSVLSTVGTEGYITHVGGLPKLTHKGWTAAQSARKTMRSGNQAFVAMWFHGDMDALFDQAFDPALRACGYAPFRVDREQHNNKIDDEIIANIRKSRLFVGDLSGMRPNVFYEAGFAHGLGVPVLLTCNESYAGAFVHASPDCSGDVPLAEKKPWFKQVADSAFDIRQYLILPWATPAELAVKLENRIRALGLALS